MAFSLKTLSLFRNLPSETLALLEKKSVSTTTQKGKLIFKAGEKAEFLYIVRKGTVKLFRTRKGSEKEEIVCVIEANGYFCLAPLLTGTIEHMNAAGLEETHLTLIPKTELLDLIDSSHEFAKNVIRSVAGKECRLCEEVCDLSLSSTKERLAKYLFEKFEANGRKSRFLLPLSQSSLAAYLGTVRETLARDLSALRKAKVIDLKHKKLTILASRELSRIAGVEENRLAILES